MKTWVMIPTYNEKENIKNLINAILNLNITNLKIVVVDDDSPDGTWKIVKDIAKKEPRVHLLLRTKNKGRGVAGIAGFKYCLNNNADYILEMDGDFSHNPKHIPQFLEKIKSYDLVLGSRFVKNGKQINRPIRRKIITRLANLYIRLVLGLKAKDCNSGYRCFKRKVLKNINFDEMTPTGPEIVQEILYKAHLKGFKIKEIPIIFRERERGKTTKELRDYIKGYFNIIKLKGQHLLGRI